LWGVPKKGGGLVTGVRECGKNAGSEAKKGGDDPARIKKKWGGIS